MKITLQEQDILDVIKEHSVKAYGLRVLDVKYASPYSKDEITVVLGPLEEKTEGK